MFGLEIDSALLPLSEALRSSADLDQRLDWALAGGDDYELLFTLPDNMPLPDDCTEMGRVVAGSGISCDRTRSASAMTTSAADHDDPTKATITDVATLIASGAGAGLSPAAPGRQAALSLRHYWLLVGYAIDLALVGVARTHCFGGVVVQTRRRRLG